MATHLYTSVAVNYLPKARVLAESIKKFHPDWMVHVILCDEQPEWLSLEEEPFDSLFNLEALGIPQLPAWKFKHDLVELSTAVKGFALQKILDLPDCTEVFYLDPDIAGLASLANLANEFENASVLLTPHSAKPESDPVAIADNELTALRHGIFNLGFIGVKNSEEGRRFSSWWCSRLRDFCYNDVPSGLFTDQRWADMVPAYFTDHKILRDPVYNVSTWNLTHRTVSGSVPDDLLVNGQPLVFYHFSGFDKGSQLEMLKKYGSTMPVLFELREWYAAACERHGQNQLSQVPWAYGTFNNGEPILSTHRKLYRETPEISSRFPNPYATQGDDQSYLQWFELHGKLPFHASADLPSYVAPPYRIFLIGAPGDSEYISESVLRIGRVSVQQSQFYLVVPEDCERDLSLPEGWHILRFHASRYEDLFAAVMGQYSDMDMVIIRAGVAPPENWDLRLAWSASHHPDALTISPLNRRMLDPTEVLSRSSDEEIDQLCYWYRQPDDPEIASFSEDCVYLQAAALKNIARPQKRFGPSDLKGSAAQFGYSHHLATHVCCGWQSPFRIDEKPSAELRRERQVRQVLDTIRGHAHPSLPVISRTMINSVLHVGSDGKEGSEQWLQEYCKVDSRHENLVLRSFGRGKVHGKEVRLYRYNGEWELLRSWPLQPAVPTTAVFHQAYKEILAEIYREFHFDRVLVWSLVGHALECLRVKLPVVFACLKKNVQGCFPSITDVKEWMMIRTEYLRAVREGGITFVAPSLLVQENRSKLNSVHYDPHRYFGGPRRPDPVWERSLQLFWRAPDEEFSENNSTTVAPLGLARQLARLYFPVPKNQKLQELRLDLSTQPGCFLLRQFSLLNVRGEKVWNWKEDASIWESLRSSQVFHITSPAVSFGSLLCLTGNDPFLILPIPADLCAGMDNGGSVEVEFTLQMSADYTHDLVMTLQESSIRRVQAETSADLLNNTLHQVQNELNVKLAERSAELKAIKTELGIKNHDFAVLENKLGLSEDTLRLSEESLRKSEEKAQELAQQAENFRLEAERWQEISVALQNSFSWRATKAVRMAAKLGRKLRGRRSE